jgi:threonine dehydrogenase-like Zn-dependent dehydrogenase
MSSTIEIPNKAVLMDGLDQLAVREYKLSLPTASDGSPIVPAGDVLVRVKVTGICGSDVRYSNLVVEVG